MAKFRIIDEEELHGREALLQYLKDTKRPGDVSGPECPICKGWGKIFHHGERATCPKCKGTGVVKESTTAGSLGAAPAGASPMQRYDAKGQPTSAVMPKRFKKKKIIKRVLPK